MWGRPPAAWKSEYYRRIGVSFELPNHYQKLTGLENLEFFASLYPGEKEDPMALLDRVGLAEHAHLRVGKYSKGMQMRLVFVRALLHKPRLLFLDEPTSGMDPANARIIKEIIKELRADGRTVFLTTHDMTTADQLCDRVAFVVDGQIAALDSPAEHKVRRSQRTVRVGYRTSTVEELQYKDFPMDTLADDDDVRDAGPQQAAADRAQPGGQPGRRVHRPHRADTAMNSLPRRATPRCRHTGPAAAMAIRILLRHGVLDRAVGGRRRSHPGLAQTRGHAIHRFRRLGADRVLLHRRRGVLREG